MRELLLVTGLVAVTAVTVVAGPPANDECANALAIPCNSSTTIDNTLATTASDDPIFQCQQQATPGQGTGSVWFTFVPTTNEAELTTCNSAGNDSLLQVLDGTCGNFTTVACNDDLPCGPSTFLSGLTVSGLTIGQTYYVDLAAWGGGDAGSYTLDVDCDSGGACCVGQDLCTDGLNAGQCFDAGGLWFGEGSVCTDPLAAGYCVGPLSCPPNALLDNDGPSCGQPAPDNNNAGCASFNFPFQSLGMGDGCAMTICGESSADDRNQSNRDTDWYRFFPVETTEYTICITAQFFPQVQIWPLNPGVDPCLGVVPGADVTGSPGETVCVQDCLLGQQPHAIRVTTVDVNGDPQRLGIGCLDYVVTVACDECTNGACCDTQNVCAENITEDDCLAAGGEYLGDGVDCIGAVCGGACCDLDGSCRPLESRRDCLDFGGLYGGRGSTCADLSCPVCVFEDPDDRDGDFLPVENCDILGIDLVNSGCTSSAPGDLFSMIQCGETVCATTAFDGGTRDLDWYHFTVADETEVVIELNNQMNSGNPMFFRMQWRMPQTGLPACDGGFNVIPTSAGEALPPGATFYSLVLAPARYTILAAFDFLNNTALPPVCPEETHYRLSITCNAPCTFSCTSTEGEADCGASNDINSGCSSSPTGPFAPLALEQEVCGTTRLIQIPDGMGGVTATRDTDWWMFNVPSTGTFAIEFEAEFNALLFLIPLDGPLECDNPTVFAFQVFQCAAAEIVVPDLPAGNYGLFVGADFNAYTWFLTPPAEELCGAPYRLNVASVGSCGGNVCADSNCDGAVTVSDIGKFVLAVAQGEAAWNADFPGGTAPCDFFCVNDINGDTAVTVSDIGGFVNAVVGGGCQ